MQDILDKLRAGSEYLGDEIAVFGYVDGGTPRLPVFLAESKRDGFADFLRHQNLLPQLLRNQTRILRNQDAIVKNQKKILRAHARLLAREQQRG